MLFLKNSDCRHSLKPDLLKLETGNRTLILVLSESSVQAIPKSVPSLKFSWWSAVGEYRACVKRS